jgi:hypothetical protein
VCPDPHVYRERRPPTIMTRARRARVRPAPHLCAGSASRHVGDSRTRPPCPAVGSHPRAGTASLSRVPATPWPLQPGPPALRRTAAARASGRRCVTVRPPVGPRRRGGVGDPSQRSPPPPARARAHSGSVSARLPAAARARDSRPRGSRPMEIETGPN